ncbi:hypothetical protein ACHAXR_008385 [Thalassiosira sp. AJA248-18]
MMTPLHSQVTTILLLVLPAVSALVVPSSSRLSIRQIQSVRNDNLRKLTTSGSRKESRSTQLSLGIDPTDIIAQHAHVLHHAQHTLTTAAQHDATSTLDMLSSFTLAKANIILPNQSLAPLPETIQNGPNMIEAIPDMPSLPGGVPRTGNAFLAESFRELYDGTLKANPESGWNSAIQSGSSDGSVLVVPAREWDVVARYADLINRIPLAATVYALVDFFLINAEEDMAIAELLDDDEEVVMAIMEVENRVVMQRFVGLFMVVIATVAWSLLSYHPVPFNEL